jgi:hypothetical protein
MNKDSFQERLKELEKMSHQSIANFNVIEGAKQEIQFWLNKLDESKKVE